MSNKKQVAVAINDIHKEFILPQHKNTTFKQTVVNIVKKNNKVTQKVLDGVSFEVNKGDFFGIVGRNGSGKSTLLKLIAGVYSPTAGDVKLNGGLTPFIELGVGFNPELSGRDNVFLNGALLGYDRKQMAGMYDEIVEFAELGPFMDQKLKNYSSGMQIRLAFSIAIKAKNEILIFDEVLAVGDEAFQRKCLDVFEQYKAEGQTVILVTHDMETVRRFCNRAVLIHEGKVLKVGDPREVADKYSKLNQVEIDKNEAEHNSRIQSSPIGLSAELSIEGMSKTAVSSGVPMELTVQWSANNSPAKIVINLYKKTGEYIIGLRAPVDNLHKDKVTLSMSPRLGLGKYHFTVEAYDDKSNLIGDIYHASDFTVIDTSLPAIGDWGGLLAIDHSWK